MQPSDPLAVEIREFGGGRGGSSPREFEDVPYPFPERAVEAAGVRVVYVDEGKGVPLIFLPPAGRGLTHDEKLYPRLLEKGRRVIGLDLPGWGKSEKPDASYSIEWYLHFLEKFLEALAIERAVLVGNSMGGLLAGILAARFPAKVAGAVLVAPAGGPIPFVKRQVAGLLLSESRLRVASPRAWRLAMGQDFHHPIPELEALVKRGLAISRGKGWPLYCRALARGAKAALAADLVPHLSAIRCPVLLVWGREDRICPLAWLEVFGQRIARRRVHVIEGCGHFPAIERPEELLGAVEGWLREEVDA